MVTAERVAQALGTAGPRRRRGVTPEELQAQVRTGLPYSALEAVAAGFAIGPGGRPATR